MTETTEKVETRPTEGALTLPHWWADQEDILMPKEEARLLFYNRDALTKQLAQVDADLKSARLAHYTGLGRGGLPTMERFRSEVGA